MRRIPEWSTRRPSRRDDTGAPAVEHDSKGGVRARANTSDQSYLIDCSSGSALLRLDGLSGPICAEALLLKSQKINSARLWHWARWDDAFPERTIPLIGGSSLGRTYSPAELRG